MTKLAMGAAGLSSLMIAAATASYAQSLPTPVVSYDFESVSGKTVTNNGSLGAAENGTTVNNSQTATPGYNSATALSTTTSAAYMTIPAFDLGTSFTIFTYAKLPNQQTTTNNDINSIWSNSGGGFQTSGFRFYVNTYEATHPVTADDDGTLHLEIGNGTAGTGVSSVKTNSVDSLSAPITSNYHSLALTVSETPSGSNFNYAVAFYLDGVQITSTTTSLATTAASTNATGYVGSLGTSNYTTGNFDDFQIYNTALSATQVAALNSSFAPAAAPEPGALALLGFGALTPAVAGLGRARRRRRSAA